MHAQTYNLVAKKLRDQFPTGNADQLILVIRGTLIDLSMEFAKSFKQDNKKFDVIKFLDQCSPNPNLYPISELWEEYGGSS
jgi:hypothetical protein